MKYKRFIACILAFIIFSVCVVYAMSERKNDYILNTKSEILDSDRKTAEDISDMTGLSVNQLLGMKTEGKSWNEILETLDGKVLPEEKKMSDEELELFLAENQFEEEEVSYDKFLAERIDANLKDIARSNMGVPNAAVPSIKPDSGNKDNEPQLADYQSLQNKFDKNRATYFMLEFTKDFGTAEAVADEYLYCLQTDIDFNLYITDREAYSKATGEKMAVLTKEKAITIAKIDTFVMELLNPKKEKNGEQDEQKSPEPKPAVPTAAIPMDKPDAPNRGSVLPIVENPKPAMPGADVMKEIDDINGKWMK